MKKYITVYVLQFVCYPYGSREYFAIVKNHEEAEKLRAELTDASKDHYWHILNTKKLSYESALRYAYETDYLIKDSTLESVSGKEIKALFKGE